MSPRDGSTELWTTVGVDIVFGMGSVMGVGRVWHGELGWGVLDSSETPGGWAHWSHIDTTRFCAVAVGEVVEFEWEERGQDGVSSPYSPWIRCSWPSPTIDAAGTVWILADGVRSIPTVSMAWAPLLDVAALLEAAVHCGSDWCPHADTSSIGSLWPVGRTTTDVHSVLVTV